MRIKTQMMQAMILSSCLYCQVTFMMFALMFSLICAWINHAHYDVTVIICATRSIDSLIPPLHRGCDHCASLVRPQNWTGRRWRHKGGRKVAWVVQGWHRGCHGRRKVLSMFKTVAQSRRGGWSLTGRSKEARGRHTHRHGRRMDAQVSDIGRSVKKCALL